METCGAADVVGESPSQSTYLCTLDAGHPANPDGATITHRCDYREMDPDNPPFTRPAFHEWTVPVAGTVG